jgi:hypothetical protein
MILHIAWLPGTPSERVKQRSHEGKVAPNFRMQVEAIKAADASRPDAYGEMTEVGNRVARASGGAAALAESRA